MAYTKLNHQQIREKMTKAGLRAVDLSRQLGVSRQLTNHILIHGGLKYAAQLAEIFNCDVEEITFTTKKTGP